MKIIKREFRKVYEMPMQEFKDKFGILKGETIIAITDMVFDKEAVQITVKSDDDWR